MTDPFLAGLAAGRLWARTAPADTLDRLKARVRATAAIGPADEDLGVLDAADALGDLARLSGEKIEPPAGADREAGAVWGEGFACGAGGWTP